jgi:hypothetical protein
MEDEHSAMVNRRHVLTGLLAAPMIIRIPGLLMPVRRVDAAPARFGLDSQLLGTTRIFWFNDAVTLKHDPVRFILPAAKDIVTIPGGSSAVFRSLGDGNWVCDMYQHWTPA